MTTETIKFKQGSVRSLAMALSSVLAKNEVPDAQTQAWDFAKSHATLDEMEVNKLIQSTFFDTGAPLTASKKSESKNSKIREMWFSGHTTSEIAKALCHEYSNEYKNDNQEVVAPYQRAQNVVKNTKKKLLKWKSENVAVGVMSAKLGIPVAQIEEKLKSL